jgi:hypothetical protein
MDDMGAEFFNIITNDFKTVEKPAGGLCSDGIKEAFLALDGLKNDSSSWTTLKKDYNLCDEVT